MRHGQKKKKKQPSCLHVLKGAQLHTHPQIPTLNPEAPAASWEGGPREQGLLTRTIFINKDIIERVTLGVNPLFQERRGRHNFVASSSQLAMSPGGLILWQYRGPWSHWSSHYFQQGKAEFHSFSLNPAKDIFKTVLVPDYLKILACWGKSRMGTISLFSQHPSPIYQSWVRCVC